MSCLAGICAYLGEAEAKTIVERMLSTMRYRLHASDAPLIERRSPTGRITLFAGEHALADESSGRLAVVEGEIYATPGPASTDTVETSPGGAAQALLGQLSDSDNPAFPRHINGAYSAAVWNAPADALYLVRDHAGCRSLYYAPFDKGIVFASTAAAVLASGKIDTAIDPASVDAFFGLKALCPPRTMFKRVFALRPGHVLRYTDEACEQLDYWQLHRIRVDAHSGADALSETLQATIKDAVRLRQKAGGRYCALVSGGVDTSAVASLLNRLPGSPHPLRGLSIAFDEVAYSDAGLQAHIVKALGVDQHERVLKPAEFADQLSEAVAFLDAPVNDAALVGMYTAFGMARAEGYTAVFDGEGPDELFPAGNTQGELSLERLLRLSQPLRRLIFGALATSLPLGDTLLDRVRRVGARLALPDDERRLTWRPLLHTAARRQLLSEGYCTGIDPYETGKAYLALADRQDALNLYQYGLMKTFLPDDLLYKNERMASAHRVMNRTPLVDYRLMEIALRIPSRYQIQKPTPTTDGIKLLYKRALRGIVPDAILDRKKERGFSQPTRVWYCGPLKEFLHETILGSRAMVRGIFDGAFLKHLFSEHVSGKANHDSPLTALLIFELWLNAQERR